MKFLGLILLLLPIGPIFGQDLAGLVRDVDQTLSVRNAFGQVIGNACLIAGTLVETAPLCALTTTTPTQQNLAHRKQLLGQACKGINTLAGGTLDATGGQVRAMATEDGVKASFRKQVGTKIRNYLSSGNLEQKKAEIWRMLGHEGVPDHSGDGIVFDLTMQTLQGNNWEQKEEVKRMLNSLGDVWAT